MQPPARCRARRAEAFALIVENINRNDSPARAEGGKQGGVVGEPKVVAKPDKSGSHV